MRLLRPALVLLSMISSPALALDAGQRVSTPKDPSPNLNRPIVKQLTVPDGPGSLILGSKTLSDFLPSVDSDGNMTVLPGRKIGRVQDNKFISQPDAIQIQGSGSTGDATTLKAQAPGTPNPLTLGEVSAGTPQIKAFGAPNGTNWSAAFAAAEAAAAAAPSPMQVLVPPSSTPYATGRAPFALNAPYTGPGNATLLSSGGDYLPANFAWILQRPFGGTGTGYNKYFSADGRYQRRDYRIIGSGLRVGLDEPYFAPELAERLSITDNRGGHAGFVARLTAPTAIGATQVQLASVDTLTVGMQIGFNSQGGELASSGDRTTITAISGKTITVSPALSKAHAAFDYVTNGVRTMHAAEHSEYNHRGGGDAYIKLYRLTIGGPIPAGTDHVFQTKTGGFDGGDINFESSGGYATIRETSVHDNGYDVAVSGEVRSFVRDNNTAARGAFWIGNLFKSEGAKPADVANAVIGKWNTALDTVQGDFSSFGNTAVNMKQGQGITLDSRPDTTELYALWGKIRGRTWWGMEDGEVRQKVDGGGTQVLATAVTADGQFRQIRKPMVTAEATAPMTLTGSYQPLALTSVYDAMGDYNASTGRFTCRVSGRYRVHFRVTMAGSTAANTGVIANVFKNAGPASANGQFMAVAIGGPLRSASAETILPCNTGEYLDVRAADGDASGGILMGSPTTGFTIEYLG